MLDNLLHFIATWEHSRVFLLFLFMGTFLAIIYYLTGNKARSERLESYKNIPFMDDEALEPKSGDNSDQNTIKDQNHE